MLFCFFLLILATTCLANSSVTLDVVYPRNHARVNVDKDVFVYGNVRPFNAAVFVQGKKARKYAEGVFLVRIPAKPGAMTVKISAISGKDTTTVEREIFVPEFRFETVGRTAQLDENFAFPAYDFSVPPGDKILLLVKGTPLSRATFEIPGLTQPTAIRELRRPRNFKMDDLIFSENRLPALPNVRGIYAAQLTVPADNSGKDHEIIFRLQARDGTQQTLTAPGRLRVQKPEERPTFFVEQRQIFPDHTLETGGLLVLPENSRVFSNRYAGDFVSFGDDAQDQVWIPTIETFSDSLARQLKQTRILDAQVRSYADFVQIKIALSQRTGYKIEQDVNSLSTQVTLLNIEPAETFEKAPQIVILKESLLSPGTEHAQSSGRGSEKDAYSMTILDSIKISQSEGENTVLDLQFSGKRLWGYKAFFEETTLVLEFRRAPQFSPDEAKPLKNLIICLDPGHGPATGSVGPSRLAERDMTMEYSLTLKKMLEARGATVVLTRQKNTGINIYSRAALAEFIDADLFLSLHFNALPDNASPFRVRGSGTYFYHDQSAPLAEAVQKQLGRRSGLPNFGVRRGNFAVCRTTAMPAILIETAFIVQPLEEQRIKSPQFQQTACRAIADGVVDFIRQSR